jgi:aromatic-L-amino-acid/L-tryptophan decarboxylase
MPASAPTGDLPVEEFRHHAHATVDWIAGYLEGVGELPVLPAVRPGEIAARLPASAPGRGEPLEDILRDFREVLLPGVTHWNHPGFLAYFAITGSVPGILGEMLAAALNTNAMLWRTGPAQTELEERTLDWLRELLGLPAAFRGTIQDTASISTLIALAAARERAVPGVRETGLSGVPPLALYASEEVHSSVDKGAITLGLGRAAVRRIATDPAFRMDPAELERTIERDRAAGALPFCVVATVGTTSTSSIDPVAEIADVCTRQRLWLHVDAAYGGSAALVPELRHVLEGAERADSLVVNPHKWMFVPVDCSALYARRPEEIRRAFSLVPEYLQTTEGDGVTNLMDYGPALGKRFRSLKLWMTLRAFGAEGMAARIREHVALARAFAGWVDSDPDWELLAPVPLSLVVFRHRARAWSAEAADALNEGILGDVNAGGRILLSHTRVRGRFALRLAVGNLRTGRDRIEEAWRLLRHAASARFP